VAPFDQSDVTDTISGSMNPITADTPFDAAIDPAGLATRLGAARPAATSAPGVAWSVSAAPGYSVGATAGVLLAAAPVAMTDTTFSASFGNPFAMQHWQPMLTYFGVAARAFTTGGAMVTLTSSLVAIVDPARGIQLKTVAAGLPTAIALAGTALASDGMTVSVDPTQAIAIDITADAASALYLAELDEIAVVGTSATRTPVVSVAGPATHLVLPPSVMQHGHTYVIVATCIGGGFANAASGDFQTFTLPVARGAATSGVFTLP
jgi:hypothetical protein